MTTDPDLKHPLSDIKRDLLAQIILNMRHRQISIPEAQHLAQEFLQVLPVGDKESLFDKLAKLGEAYPEARAVSIKYAIPYEEEKKQQVLAKIQEHMENGQFEQAAQVGQTITAQRGPSE